MVAGRGGTLRSKTPDLCQEIDGLMLAHYAVRCLIREAADKAGEDPDRMSFVHAVRAMHRWIINPGAFPPVDRPDGVLDEILEGRVVSSRGQAPWRQAENGRLSPPLARPCVTPGTPLDAGNRPELRRKQQYCP